MNWEALGAIAEMLGAIAVLATLAYLAMQIRQNSRASIAATNHSITRSRNEVNLELAHDSELAELVIQGSSDIRSLNPIEQLRVSTYWTAMFNTFEDIFIQHKKGFADEGQHEAMMNFLVPYLTRSAGLQYWWARNKQSWTEEFQREISGVLTRTDA